MEKAAPTLKRLSLELGGKSPAIVVPDADINNAVSEIVKATIVLNGQMCTCISRVLVSKKIEQELTASLKKALGSVKIGHGLDPSMP